MKTIIVDYEDVSNVTQEIVDRAKSEGIILREIYELHDYLLSKDGEISVMGDEDE